MNRPAMTRAGRGRAPSFAIVQIETRPWNPPTRSGPSRTAVAAIIAAAAGMTVATGLALGQSEHSYDVET